MNFSLKVFHREYSGSSHPGDLCWKQVSLQMFVFGIFCTLTGFMFQGMVELFLGLFEGKTTSQSRNYCVKFAAVSVLCHAVPLGNFHLQPNRSEFNLTNH